MLMFCEIVYAQRENAKAQLTMPGQLLDIKAALFWCCILHKIRRHTDFAFVVITGLTQNSPDPSTVNLYASL